MINRSDVEFLQQLAIDADHRYMDLLDGIAIWYEKCGCLSPKQLISVEVSAKKQGKSVPEAFYGPQAVEQRETPAIILADLAETLAAALHVAAERLLKVHERTTR